MRFVRVASIALLLISLGCAADAPVDPATVDMSDMRDRDNPVPDMSDTSDMSDMTDVPDMSETDLASESDLSQDMNSGADMSVPDMFSCAPLDDCSGVCIDTQTAIQHCGACNEPCVAPAMAQVESCTSGECVFSCLNDRYDVNMDLQEPGSDGCEADCMPDGAEICDGGDNNCDNTIDEGCPDAVSLANSSDGPSFGGTGGSLFRADCPAGMVLVGMTGQEGSRVDRIQGVCEDLTIFEDVNLTPYEYSARSQGSSLTLPAQGGTGGVSTSALCPPGEVVIGMFGREDNELESLTIRCGEIEIVDTGNGFEAQRVQSVDRIFGGGSSGNGFSYDCPGASVVTGLFGRDSTTIDSLGFACADVNFSLR